MRTEVIGSPLASKGHPYGKKKIIRVALINIKDDTELVIKRYQFLNFLAQHTFL